LNLLELPQDVLDPRVTEDLNAFATAGEHARIRALSARFGVRTPAVGYECRLLRDDQRVDYNLALFADERLPQALAEASNATASEAWLQATRLLTEWVRGGAAWCANVPFVCAAFDLEPNGSEALPPPCVSLCVDSDFHARRLGLRLPAPAVAAVTRVAAALAHHFDQPLHSEQAATIRLVLNAGQRVEARHLSLMAGRPDRSLKLDVRVWLASMGDLLAKLPWVRQPHAIAREVHELVGTGGAVQLNLPLLPQPSSPVEVELFTGRARPEIDERLRFIETLGLAGLISPEKAEALRHISERPQVHTGRRWIGRSWYVKVRVHPDGRRDAKAYLGFVPARAIGASALVSNRPATTSTLGRDSHG
jgi:hypothetical protein